MGRLQDKVAIVTGAGSGNGRGMAVAFAHEGADVVIADLDVQADGMQETARLVEREGRNALTVTTDVSRTVDIDALVRATVERFGRLDVAVANAGVAERDTDCLRMTEAQWDRTIDINLKGVFFTLQAAANEMIREGRQGRLIAIASIMAEWAAAGSPAYCASKGGVKQLVKSFGQACGHHGITCNAIGPGYIETPMTSRLKEFPALEAALVDHTPIGRLGQPADVANVAVFLASDESGFMNGTTVFPDGGITSGNYSNAMRLAMLDQLGAQGR